MNSFVLEPIEGKLCQPTASDTSTCLHTEGKDHPACSGVTCGQHVESPSQLLVSRLELSLKINKYSNYS